MVGRWVGGSVHASVLYLDQLCSGVKKKCCDGTCLVPATSMLSLPMSTICSPGGYHHAAGDNFIGQLGTNDTAQSNVPQVVLGSTALNFSQVQAAYGFTCGLQANGGAWCWGGNSYGSLGTGGTSSSLVPVMVTGGYAFTQISATHDSTTVCGTTAAGDAFCWGSGVNGQIVNGNSNSVNSPTLVSGGLNFTQISSGGGTTCGVTVGYVAYCWG